MDASALSKAAEVLRNSIADIESGTSSFETFSNWAGLTVLVGCAIELYIIAHEHREELKAFRRNSIRTPEKPSGWLLFFGIVGISLVVLGIGGELWASLRVQRLQGDVQGKNRELTKLFEGAFSDALERAAKNESEAADALQKAANALGLAARLAAVAPGLQSDNQALKGLMQEFQSQALGLQGQLKAANDQILANGPRSDAINKAAPELIKALGLFQGQRVSIYMAAYMTAPPSQGPTDGEAGSTLWSIRRLLADGSKWKIVGPEVKYSPLASVQGIGLLINLAAPEQTTKAAAKALADGLTRALPQSSIRTTLLFSGSYRRIHGSLSPKGFQLPEGDDPEAKVFSDPDLIVVLIGGHPIP